MIRFLTKGLLRDRTRSLFGPDGIAEWLHTGQIVVDMSTISPETTDELAVRLDECAAATGNPGDIAP